MASFYTLGQGLGNFFKAAMNSSAIQQNAYNTQVRQDLGDRLLQGKVNDQTAADTAYTNMPGDINQMTGGQNGQALTDMTRATGSHINQLGDFMRRLAQMSYLKGAVDAGSRGDTQAQNVQLAAGGAKPLDETQIAGNTAFNPNMTPTAQKLQVTPYGSQDLANKFIANQTKAHGQNVIPLNQGYLKAFSVTRTDNMGLPHTAFDANKFNAFTMWANDKGERDLNNAYPNWIKQVQYAQTHATEIMAHATAALHHGASLAAVQRRLLQLQVDPAVVAKLQR